MKVDLSLPVTQPLLDKLATFARARAGVDMFGHMGTHLDLMGKQFDLDTSETEAVIFDVSAVEGEILPEDVDLSKVKEGVFVLFHTGVLEKFGYGSSEYFHQEAPQLSYELIDLLVEKKVVFIGVDMGGIRKMVEHAQVDQYCADRGVFNIENLVNLKPLLQQTGGRFRAHVYPLNLADATGLPCRVIAEV